MKIGKILFGLVLVSLLGCDKDDATPTRPFYMGFTPWPYDATIDAVNYTYNEILQSSDIINHHFDFGVPWVEALNNSPYSDHIMNDWQFRKSKTPDHHKVIVSLTALNNERNGLAYYRGEQDVMPLPPPWDTYRFNSTEVKTAYVNHCKALINFFEPDYFNMNVEANILYLISPTKWSDFVEFHQYVYTELKTAYPELIIFSSVAGVQILEGFVAGNDHVQQRLATMQILDHSDLFGISFYPHLSEFAGKPWPENTFETLFTLSPKQIAIAETGYPAETFMINTNGTDVTINADETLQKKFFDDLLTAATKHNAAFVINFTIRDYDQLWERSGSPHDLFIAWKDTGLINQSGDRRPAYTTWSSYFKKNLKLPD